MTAVKIWDNIRKVIEDKREEINMKYGRRPTQQDVASSAILAGIDQVEKKLGFQTTGNEKNDVKLKM
jgi:hypothetical protein